MEEVPQPYLGDNNDHHGYENHLQVLGWSSKPIIYLPGTWWVVPAIQPSESAGSLGSNFVRPRHGRVVAPRPLENSSLPKKKAEWPNN